MGEPKYPGETEVINGNGAVARVMNLVCGGVIGYPITPSTEISETFQLNVAAGQKNVWGQHPFFFEPEGEHSAQSGAMGAALTGGKFISNASSSQGILYALESHYVTVGKRIGGFVLQVASRVFSRHSLNVMGGHDDVYSLLPAGYTVLFGATPEEAADLALISYRTSALSLIPVANCMDGFSTSHMMSEARLPGPDLVKEYLGDPGGYIHCPTVAQEILFGAAGRVAQFGGYLAKHRASLSRGAREAIDTLLASRPDECEADTTGEIFDTEIAPALEATQVATWRRQWVNAPVKGTRKLIPSLVDLDNPGMTGGVQNQPDFQAGVADHRTHFVADVPRLVCQAMAEYNALTGRDYQPVRCFDTEDADYIFVGLGSICEDIQAVLPHLRALGLRVGLVQITLLQPFPEAELVEALRGATQVTVLERSDQAALSRLVDTALVHAAQNAVAAARGQASRFPGIPGVDTAELPLLSTGFFGIGGHDVQPRHLIATAKAMAAGDLAPEFYLGSTFFDPAATGELKMLQDKLRRAYPETERMSLHLEVNPPDLLSPETLRIRFHSVGGYGTIATGKLLADILAEVLGLYSKAAPKYGSEKSGAPTNYYITLAPEPIKITNADLEDVEIVVSPDHMVFAHDNPLRGLRPGGTFIVQSKESPATFWAGLPPAARETIRQRGLNVFVLDAFGVAKRHAPTTALQTRMMGVAFIGAIGAKVDRIAAGATEADMLAKIREQIEHKFGNKGASVVEANMAVITEGAAAAQRVDWEHFDAGTDDSEMAPHEPGETKPSAAARATGSAPGEPAKAVRTKKQLPVISTQMCQRDGCPALTKGLFNQDYFDKIMAEPFAAGTISESPVYPGMGFFMPPASSAAKNKGLFRLQMPVFHANTCTGCMECALVCPDGAIPNTVFRPVTLVETAVREAGTVAALLLPKASEIAEAMREHMLSRKDRPSISEVFRAGAAMVFGVHEEPAEDAGAAEVAAGESGKPGGGVSSPDAKPPTGKMANPGKSAGGATGATTGESGKPGSVKPIAKPRKAADETVALTKTTGAAVTKPVATSEDAASDRAARIAAARERAAAARAARGDSKESRVAPREGGENAASDRAARIAAAREKAAAAKAARGERPARATTGKTGAAGRAVPRRTPREAPAPKPLPVIRDAKILAAVDAVAGVLATYPVAQTRPFFDVAEKKNPGSGVLFAATVDPWKCTGCLECVAVCAPGCLVPADQDAQVLAQAKERFEYLAKLPNSPDEISDPNSGPTLDLKRILLNHDNYYATIGGHGACKGCGEVTAIRQTMALANEINRHRVKNHRAELEELVSGLRAWLDGERGVLAAKSKVVSGAGAVEGDASADSASTVEESGGLATTAEAGATGAGLDATAAANTGVAANAADPALREVAAAALARLEHRLYRYEGPGGGRGPAGTVVANSTGCSSVYASTAPYNSYQEPWVNGLFQDAQPLAKGIFEGLAADLSPDILAMRQARAILGGATQPEQIPHDPPQWQAFSDAELALMPAVMTISGDGAAYDIGFGAMSRVLASGTPLKMLVLDTGAYSNTGGQASTASFEGQDADLSRHGKYLKGKAEQRKELALLAAMHPEVLVISTTPAFQMHFLKNVSRAMSQTDYPAVIDVYTPCQPEHGIGDDQAADQSKLAVKSRLSPLFVHEPAGADFPERFLIDGNPELRKLWASQKLNYVEEEEEKTLNLPYTPADFAYTEGRFRKHFDPLPGDAPNPVPVADFIELPEAERGVATPFIYAVDAEQHLRKIRISPQMVRLTEQCKEYWQFLQYLAGQDLAELRKTNEKLEAELAKLQAAAAAAPETSD